MNNLLDFVNKERNVNDIQLTKNIIGSYIFIDYAIVKDYKDGVISVTLAHPIQKQEITIVNVEVLSHGSKGFSTVYELVSGDIVQIFSSRSFIETVADFVSMQDRMISAYDIATIKAVPITDAPNALNKLNIAADGAYTLEGENYSIEVDSLGNVKVTATMLELNGKNKSLVTWGELNIALTTFLANLTIALTTTPIIGLGSPQPVWTGLPVAIDITAAKTTTILTDG